MGYWFWACWFFFVAPWLEHLRLLIFFHFLFSVQVSWMSPLNICLRAVAPISCKINLYLASQLALLAELWLLFWFSNHVELSNIVQRIIWVVLGFFLGVWGFFCWFGLGCVLFEPSGRKGIFYVWFLFNNVSGFLLLQWFFFLLGFCC